MSKHPALQFDRVIVGKRVRKAREDKGLTTEQLAEKTKIGTEALYKKQRGEAPFNLDELPRVRDALGAPGLFPLLDWKKAEWLDKMIALMPDLE